MKTRYRIKDRFLFKQAIKNRLHELGHEPTLLNVEALWAKYTTFNHQLGKWAISNYYYKTLMDHWVKLNDSIGDAIQ